MEGHITTLNAQQTAEVLRSLGMKVSPEKVRNGIQQGAYPFGDYIMIDRQPSVTIYEPLLRDWIAARLDR